MKATNIVKTWDVYVVRDGNPHHIGEVHEQTESLARCAALHRFGIGDDPDERAESEKLAEAIGPEDEFEVSPKGRAPCRAV